MHEPSEAVQLNDSGSVPDWMIPQSLESIGYCLADSVRRLSGLAAAVIVRHPATETASVVATSAGAERRLVGWVVPPACAAGRACVADVVTLGNSPEELLGCDGRRRRYVNQGVAFSLTDGLRSVGALVVFASPDHIDGATNDCLMLLAKEAGCVIGRALALGTAEQRGLIDEVTGQLNREGLERAIRDSFQEPCAVVCADFDQFPQLDPGLVNVVLKHIANTIRRAVRSYDFTARIERDEFALFLPATPLDSAVEVAQRIRMAVGESEIDFTLNDGLTCSFGVASIPETASNVTDLMAAAAEAAKEAQDRGHNCVVAAQPRDASARSPRSLTNTPRPLPPLGAPMTLLQNVLYGRTLEDPDDPFLHLTLAAAGARTPQALWQEVAEVLSTMYGCAIQIDFVDRMTIGSVTAGESGNGGGTPQIFELGEGQDDRVRLTLVPGAAAVPGGKVEAILTAAMVLAGLVTRRALLDLERRRGAFLVELSSWMLEASADPRSLVKHTLQSAMDLVGGQAALVALSTADGSLQVVSAVGEIEDQWTAALQLVEAVIGQALSQQSPVLTPRIEDGCREVPDDLRRRFGAAMLVPMGDTGPARGVVCVLQAADGLHPGKPFTQDDVGNLETVAPHILACVGLIEAVEAAGRAAQRANSVLEECDLPLACVAPIATLTRANNAFSSLLGFEDKHDVVGRDVTSLPMVLKGNKLGTVLDQARSGLPWQGRIHLLRGDDLRRCVGVVTRLVEADSEELLLAICDKTEEFLGQVTQNKESDEAVGDVMEEVDRAATVAKEVLALSPPATDLMERVNIDQLVRNVIEIRARVLHTEPAEIRADLGSHKSLVLAVPEDLQQLLVNLMRNAEQAISGRSDGRILVETTRVNGHVHARVSDSGPGVDPDLRTRIFDPFFTTKDRDSASGLGLAVSKRIVSALRGKIWVEDAVLGGASFVVVLPTTTPLA